MRSLQQQIVFLLLGSLVLLSTCFIAILGWHMKDRAEAAAFIKAQTDLATCMEIIDKTYPGPWSLQNDELYKGTTKISLNNDFVDHLSSLTGDTVTIFSGDTRVATTVLGSNNERAIGTKASENVVQTVLQNGQTFVGKANVVGQWYETGYVPLRAANGKILGMFYVGISHAYEQKIITWSLITLVMIGLALTLFAALITWFFLQKLIINPLHDIMLGTRDVATGHHTEKITVSGAREIEELEEAFNQMVERIQVITEEISRTEITRTAVGNTHSDAYETGFASEMTKPSSSSPLPLASLKEEILPKGFNQATLEIVTQFVFTTPGPLSAEEVAEGVKLTRVTVRHYLEFLEQRGLLRSELKYGTVGRPVKLFIPVQQAH